MLPLTFAAPPVNAEGVAEPLAQSLVETSGIEVLAVTEPKPDWKPAGEELGCAD